jgi:hypothetical protein
MSRYIVLREKGSQETLLVDKATLTVTRLDADATKALELANAGAPTTDRFSGLEFGFSVEYRTKAPARMLYREELPLAG